MAENSPMRYKNPRSSSSTPQLHHEREFSPFEESPRRKANLKENDRRRVSIASPPLAPETPVINMRSPPPSVKRRLKAAAMESEANAAARAQQVQMANQAANASVTSSLYYNIVEPTVGVLSDVTAYWIRRCLRSLVPGIVKRSLLQKEMEEAKSYAQWRHAALELDDLDGKNAWKMEFESDMYDSTLIDRRLDDIRKARTAGDHRNLMFMLRAGLFRNLGNMNNPALFTYCNVGTKRLVERYTEEVVRQLEFIANEEIEGVTLADKIEFFRDVRLAFGRTALMLSGGGALGSYHIGVVKVLLEQKLLPRIITGSSAGSIISAVISCFSDDELLDMFRKGELTVDAFVEKDTAYPLLRKIRRLFQEGTMGDAEQLKEAVRRHVKDMTFQEAYNSTRRILNISVNSNNPHEGPRLLNYLTAPHVVIWSAVCASCSLTYLFKPVELMAKTKDGRIVPWGLSGEEWVDGSIETDLPTTRISELFNVNHFIVSQVNPHVLPYMHPKSPIAKFIETFPWLCEFVMAELRHRVSMLKLVFPGARFWDSIMSQRYSGNITIVPPVALTDMFRVVDHPTPDDIKRCAKIGERATWPKVNMITIHCAIELTLDRIFYRLQERVFDQRDHNLAQADYVANPTALARALSSRTSSMV